MIITHTMHCLGAFLCDSSCGGYSGDYNDYDNSFPQIAENKEDAWDYGGDFRSPHQCSRPVTVSTPALVRPTFALRGVGAALPQKIITNQELSETLDTSHEWIQSRTGICQRHVVTTETLSQLATQACEKALKEAGWGPLDVDLVILATTTPDHMFPPSAMKVIGNLGALKAVAFDINVACSGFVYALVVANGFLMQLLDQRERDQEQDLLKKKTQGSIHENAQIQGASNGDTAVSVKALIIGGDTLSRLLNWEDRSTAVLFGDGAGAAAMEMTRHGIAQTTRQAITESKKDVTNATNDITNSATSGEMITEAEAEAAAEAITGAAMGATIKNINNISAETVTETVTELAKTTVTDPSLIPGFLRTHFLSLPQGYDALYVRNPQDFGSCIENDTENGIENGTRRSIDKVADDKIAAENNVKSSQNSGQGCIVMEGREVFRQAVVHLESSARAVLDGEGLTISDVDWVICHQANKRILDAVAQRLGLPEDKMVYTGYKHANTSAASIPLALEEVWSQGKLHPGQLILFQSFGAGFTCASALLRL